MAGQAQPPDLKMKAKRVEVASVTFLPRPSFHSQKGLAPALPTTVPPVPRASLLSRELGSGS
eukprot:2994641-Pleurochrysis_carterae.AAC.1